jgi:3'(2'), 5'-bisphosphate nucleotidase
MRQDEMSGWWPSVITLARQAGEAIMPVYGQGGGAGVAVAHKADQSPLTQADLAAHHCIVAGLSALTPHIPVVSEEDAASYALRNRHSTFWLIDPLDGTKEFLARNGEFTVNIALVSEGVAIWGVVFAPTLNGLYAGGPGLVAQWHAQGGMTRLAVAPPPEPGAPCRVVASKSHLNDDTRQFIAALEPASLVQVGSSLKLCLVAQGAADIYPRLGPTCEWDTAAAQAVLEGAGGHVTTLQGEPIRYGKPDVLNPWFVACAHERQANGAWRP